MLYTPRFTDFIYIGMWRNNHYQAAIISQMDNCSNLPVSSAKQTETHTMLLSEGLISSLLNSIFMEDDKWHQPGETRRLDLYWSGATYTFSHGRLLRASWMICSPWATWLNVLRLRWRWNHSSDSDLSVTNIVNPLAEAVFLSVAMKATDKHNESRTCLAGGGIYC